MPKKYHKPEEIVSKLRQVDANEDLLCSFHLSLISVLIFTAPTGLCDLVSNQCKMISQISA